MHPWPGFASEHAQLKQVSASSPTRLFCEDPVSGLTVLQPDSQWSIIGSHRVPGEGGWDLRSTG